MQPLNWFLLLLISQWKVLVLSGLYYSLGHDWQCYNVTNVTVLPVICYKEQPVRAGRVMAALTPQRS